MDKIRETCVFKVMLVILLAAPYDTVTVSPSLCPTNKIAPHRRIAVNARTFAAYYDLLVGPSGSNSQVPNPLQEEPQPDQPDDCREIEDYDENDLSSVTHQNRRRNDRADNRFFFGGLFNRPGKFPATPTPVHTPSRPPINAINPAPTRPGSEPVPLPQRPPYWSGGYFGQNQYQQPSYLEPSDNLKPVHEAADISEVPQTYRPGLVGGPIGHVVGHSPAKPTPTPDEKTRRRLEYLASLTQRPTQPTFYTTRRPRPRKLSDDSVFGSFIDLLF